MTEHYETYDHIDWFVVDYGGSHDILVARNVFKNDLPEIMIRNRYHYIANDKMIERWALEMAKNVVNDPHELIAMFGTEQIVNYWIHEVSKEDVTDTIADNYADRFSMIGRISKISLSLSEELGVEYEELYLYEEA